MTCLLNCECEFEADESEWAHTEAESSAEEEGCASLAKLHDSSRATPTYTRTTARSQQ
jgi:hypothetical protein